VVANVIDDLEKSAGLNESSSTEADSSGNEDNISSNLDSKLSLDGMQDEEVEQPVEEQWLVNEEQPVNEEQQPSVEEDMKLAPSVRTPVLQAGFSYTMDRNDRERIEGVFEDTLHVLTEGRDCCTTPFYKTILLHLCRFCP